MKLQTRLGPATKVVKDRDGSTEMTLMAHLGELRSRLLKIAIGYVITTTAAWFAYSPILAFLVAPLSKLPVAEQILQDGHLIFTAPTEAFFVRLKLTAFAGLILALPLILWQIWRFVTPGLRANEKKYAVAFVMVSLALFGLGVATAFASLPKALEVLAAFAGTELVLLPRASEYLSFVMLLIGAFGLSFEFPLVLLALTGLGVLSSLKLRQSRKIAWVVILIVAAVITPTQDPITLAMMAIPLGLLFEGTIVAARLMKK